MPDMEDMQLISFRMLTIGGSGVGKTSLLRRFALDKFTHNYASTLGLNVLTHELLVDDKKVSLQLWDTAGMERFQAIGKAYYRGTDCCLLVFDVTCRQSFYSLDFWKKEFLIHAGYDETAESNPEVPFLVVGNKADEPEAREISESQVKEWCKKNGDIPYIETSAKKDLNVTEAFETLSRLAVERRAINIKLGIQRLQIDLVEEPTGRAGCCCY